MAETMERGGGNVIDLMAQSLISGRDDGLRRVFSAREARAPTIIWSPEAGELQSPLLRRFRDVAESLSDDEGRLLAKDFSLEPFGGMSDWLMVLDVTDAGHRYAYYGPGIIEYYGRDMTGHCTSEFTTHIAQFFEALYRAAAARGERVFSEHEPPRQVFVRAWRRLIQPLFGDDGETVTRFVVLNVPENELRVGLDLMVDPVFVLDGAQTIQYANRAARGMFSIESHTGSDRTLRDVTGIALEHLPQPEDMLAEHMSDDSVQLIVRGSIVERLVMTVSATEQRGFPFYVVVMRLIGT